MSKRYKESIGHPFSHHGCSRGLNIQKPSDSIQPSDDLCQTFPHNLPSWVSYMDEPELSCRMGLDNNGPKITFSTGKNTKIDTKQVCQNITSDPKDQKACIKRLDRGLLPGINVENGEVTVYLEDNGNFSFREDGLFTDAPEYNVTDLVSAVGSAQYTQRTPDMTTLRMKATIEDNPIIGDIGMGVIGIAVMTTLANLTYLSIKSKIAKRRRPKENLSPIPINLSAQKTIPDKPQTRSLIPPQPSHEYYLPRPPRHTKNHKIVED